jgi:hypothetical protein
MDKKEKVKGQTVEEATREKEKLTRREALKRMAKGVAVAGTLGVTAVITKGQGGCGYADGYDDFYSDYYHNSYINNYDDYSNWTYSNYNNAYLDSPNEDWDYTNYNDYDNYDNYYDY